MNKNSVPDDAIPEVAAFIEAREKIERFKAAYPEVFEQLAPLVEVYNSTLQSAEKAVRALGVTCGPFVRYQESTKYDPEKLYDAVGHDGFLNVGGKTKTVTVYEVDKSRLEAFISSGALPKEVVEAVRTISPRYKAPDPIKI